MLVYQMHRGDDKKYELEVTDKRTGAAVNITGATIKLTLRETYTGGIFIQKDFTVTDGPNGKAEVVIDAADTSGLDNEKHEYLFDVQITISAKDETLCTGKFIILPDITY